MLNILVDPSNDRKIVDFRKLGFRDVLVLGRYNYAYAHKPLKKHSHGNMLEICLLDEGTQPYVVEGREYGLKGGDVMLTFPNEVHGSGDNPENRGRLYWMLIRVPGRKERFLNLAPVEGQSLVRGLLAIKSRHFKGHRMLKYYLERIFQAYDSDHSPLRHAEMKNWMVRFLLDVLADAKRLSESRISYSIKRVLDHIHQNLHGEFPSLEELAAMANLSLPRFKARFKQETGISPGNYIMTKKIEEARTLLSTARKPVTDTGLDLGFSSSQYFATVFKRYMGQTPTQFQRHVLSRPHPQKMNKPGR
ncbi:MAG: AraC family transcriptional regulator [Kiritimatiellae bacterium]|nr:AraC family transcriptional regulator [Kiritimatiellia bacterium]MDD5521725.1 AraC family transcriptional regulator [Kiritimatiellia bacterium]